MPESYSFLSFLKSPKWAGSQMTQLLKKDLNEFAETLRKQNDCDWFQAKLKASSSEIKSELNISYRIKI
jgi:hypothetical protein